MLRSILLPCLAVAACAPARELGPSRYAYLESATFRAEDEPAIRAALPYERIELQEFSTWIWGGDRITLELEGAASFAGEDARFGTVSLLEYGRLCRLIERHGFERLDARYERPWFDSLEVTVRVWPRGADEPIEVADYAEAGPPELWEIQTAIRGVAQRVRWRSAPRDGPADEAR